MKICIKYVLIYYLSNVSLALLHPSLLNKHKELLRDEIFLDIDEYGYPKINKSLRELHKKEWLNYYKCLQEIYADIGYEKIAYPSVLLALEGTSVTLKCQICISPAEIHAVNVIKWYFNGSKKDSFFKIMENMDYANSPNNQYIMIYNIKLEQAGAYWCEMGDVTGSVYYLHIDNNIKEIDIVYPDTETYPSQSVLAESIYERYDLKIYTAWTRWSPCSTCNTVGIKLRYGYCTISSLGSSMYKHIVDANVSTMDELQNNRYIKNKDKKYEWNQTGENAYETINKNIKIQLKTILWLFNNKLPCKSKFVPKNIQIIPIIKEKKTEIMKQYCKKRCRKNIIFQVRDERNNILENANNSAGIYSMIQEIPEALSVTRNVVYEKHNKKMKLVCPRNLNANVPIIWQINGKIIIPSQIKRQSNGRIYFNPQMHIIFEYLKFEDANTYSCWQNNEIAGIIKLNVSGELEFKLDHYIVLTGSIFILGIFLLIFWRAFKRRLQHAIY